MSAPGRTLRVMHASATTTPPIVIRHDLGRTAAVVVWVAAIAIVASEWPPSWSVALFALGVSGIVWTIGWRPAVVVEDRAVTVRNPLREVRLGWGGIDDAGFDWSLWLRAGEVRCRASAAPGPASMGALYDRDTSGGIITRRGPAEVAGGRRVPPALVSVRQRWAMRARGASAEVMVSRPWLAIVVLGVSCLMVLGAVVAH